MLEKQLRFTLRKLTIGLVSVAVSGVICMGVPLAVEGREESTTTVSVDEGIHIPEVRLGDRYLTEDANDTVLVAYREEMFNVTLSIDGTGTLTYERAVDGKGYLPIGTELMVGESKIESEVEFTGQQTITLQGKLSSRNEAHREDKPDSGRYVVTLRLSVDGRSVLRRLTIVVHEQAEAPWNILKVKDGAVLHAPVNWIGIGERGGWNHWSQDYIASRIEALLEKPVAHVNRKEMKDPLMTIATKEGEVRYMDVPFIFEDESQRVVRIPYTLKDAQPPKLEGELIELFRGEHFSTGIILADNSYNFKDSGVRNVEISAEDMAILARVGLVYRLVDQDNRKPIGARYPGMVKMIYLNGRDKDVIPLTAELGDFTITVNAEDKNGNHNRNRRLLNKSQYGKLEIKVKKQAEKYTPVLTVKDPIKVTYKTIRDVLDVVTIPNLSIFARQAGGVQKTLIIEESPFYRGTGRWAGAVVMKVRITYPDNSTDTVEVPVEGPFEWKGISTLQPSREECSLDQVPPYHETGEAWTEPTLEE